MNCPKWLKDEAKEFWKNHAPRLKQQGLLEEADFESFCILCEVWRLLRNTDPTIDTKMAVRYMALLKQYDRYARHFGLFPIERKKAKITPEPEDKLEF